MATTIGHAQQAETAQEAHDLTQIAPDGRSVTGVPWKEKRKRALCRTARSSAVGKNFEERKRETQVLMKAKELEKEIKKDMEEERQKEFRAAKQRRQAKMERLLMERKFKKDGGVNKKSLKRKRITPLMQKQAKALLFSKINLREVA